MSSIVVGFGLLIFAIFILTSYFASSKSPWAPDATGASPSSVLRSVASSGALRLWMGIGGVALGLLALASTSFVIVGSDSVGHLKRIYGGASLPPGKIIATDGEKGPQAEILGPGLTIRPFINVLFDVEQLPVIVIPEGAYGSITTSDGRPMPDGMFMAPAISDSEIAELLDARSFLTSDKGYRGPQETILKPGSYRLNQYLFNVDITGEATRIDAGFVGVVKSNVAQPGTVCREEKVKTVESQDAVVVPVVPRGCVGIWRDVLLPGAYYLNNRAYQVTPVDTRVQTWEYRGGFTKRIVDLSIDDQGRIQQAKREEQQRMPEDAADRAIFVKVEGWDIPVEMRVLVQVLPENAALVVGGVGGLKEIEDRILTPTIRSIVRNVAGSTIRVPRRNEAGEIVAGEFDTRPSRAFDLIDNRDALENTIESLVRVEGRKAGIEIKEVRIGEPAIPPELMISRLREQLAVQLSKAYEQEAAAQKVRAVTEAERARADQQREFVTAQISVQVAEQRQKERALLGQAERAYLEELAKGQGAQANVLGQDRVAMLQMVDKILATLEKKPELATLVGRLVPQIMVTGKDEGGLAGAAAVFGGVLNQQRDTTQGQ